MQSWCTGAVAGVSHPDALPPAVSLGSRWEPRSRPSLEITAEERDALASLVYASAGFRSTTNLGASHADVAAEGGARSAAFSRHLRSCSLDDVLVTPLSLSHPGSPSRAGEASGVHVSRDSVSSCIVKWRDCGKAKPAFPLLQLLSSCFPRFVNFIRLQTCSTLQA